MVPSQVTTIWPASEQIRDQNGTFVAGLAANIGKASNVIAELWAIRAGTILAKYHNITEICIETDSKTVFCMMHRRKAISRAHHHLLRIIQTLGDEFN